MMIMLKSTHDRAMAVKDAEIADAYALIKKLRAQLDAKQSALTFTTLLATKRYARILSLEADLAEQSSKITTLSNLNAALKRKYEPVRGPGGKWISKRAPQVLGTVVSA